MILVLHAGLEGKALAGSDFNLCASLRVVALAGCTLGLLEGAKTDKTDLGIMTSSVTVLRSASMMALASFLETLDASATLSTKADLLITSAMCMTSFLNVDRQWHYIAGEGH